MSADTAFLLVRQGDYAVCLRCEDGAFPVKIFNTRVGDIRPLGIGVGGIALLAAASDECIARMRTQAAQAIEAAGLSAATLDKVIATTGKTGYAEMVDTGTQGVAGMGAVTPVGSTLFAAISIAAIKPRMAPPRRAELGQLLIAALHQPP